MRLFRSVRTRLLFMVSIVVLAALLAVVWSSRRVTRAEFRQLVSRLETEVDGVAASGGVYAVSFPGLDELGEALQRDYRSRGDWSGAARVFDEFRRQLDERAAIVVAAGRPVATSEPAFVDAAISIAADGALRIGGAVRATDAGLLGSQEIVFRGPHRVIRTTGGDEAGTLYLVPLPDGDNERRLHRVVADADFLGTVDRGLLGVLVVVGVLALAAAVVVSARIVRPIERLTEASRRMGGGDLALRVEVDGDDEIGQLAAAFNGMAASLERNEELRRGMVSDIAHELRTPLTNLRGQLESIQDGLAQPTPALVASLHEETMLLSRLVDDLQELALADAGQLHLELEEVELVEELRRVAAEFGAGRAAGDAAAPDPVVEIRVDADLPAVRADRQRTRQVLRNLLDNAVRHGGGGVEVGARPIARPPRAALSTPAGSTGGFVAVEVTDHGRGLTAEQLERVFERFYRTDPARQRATGGAGLGLAIVRRLVEAQGGCVWAAGEPGRGCTFGFCLPVADS